MRKKLEEEKVILEKELSGVGVRDPRNAANWNASESPEEASETADLNLEADVIENLQEKHAISDDLEVRLKDVNDALNRLDKKTYGLCEVCGGEIAEKRLLADTAARTCQMHIG